METMVKEKNKTLKPILKWAGGKSQLLESILANSPKALGRKIRNYIEPFFGGGAVFFELYNRGLIDTAIIADANLYLVTLYKTIQNKPTDLVEQLSFLKKKYLMLEADERAEFFYEIRKSFNEITIEQNFVDIKKSAELIFLNKTCFNGLYRVNKKGEFNVPHGSYSNPAVYDEDLILNVSEALQNVEILHCDFEDVVKEANSDSFVYYDPPYRPLSKTASFTSYSMPFDDSEQIRLSEIFKTLDKKGVKQLLSNSDPYTFSEDDFFEKLYGDFLIERVFASRAINSKAEKRGKISEILVRNY